jgi:L-ascorbate metabolism protein UlaG (beta-lactamase superfamily)
VPLNNATYLSRALNTPLTRFHELDWWDERHLRVSLPPSLVADTKGDATKSDKPAVTAEVRLSCTPSQHMSGRAVSDRFRSLWGSWVAEDLDSHKKVYFASDTGYRTIRDGEEEETVPVCPAFAEIGERLGGFDLAMLPIGYVIAAAPPSPS